MQLLGIYPDKTIIQKDTCACMFISAQFIIAKMWKPPKCPSIDEWVKNIWHMHTMKYHSDIKEKKKMRSFHRGAEETNLTRDHELPV